MKIEKNIMATLKSGMDHSELLVEIDISRMTPQGYLNGASHLSAGSNKSLTNQLGPSTAELVAAEELYSAENPDVDTLCQNSGYLYCLHEMWNPCRRSLSYGIFVKECINGSWFTVAMVAPFSGDRTATLGLIDLCTRLQLDPEHLLDVVQDFLTQQALTT